MDTRLDTKVKFVWLEKKFPGICAKEEGLLPTIEELIDINSLKKSYELSQNLFALNEPKNGRWLSFKGFFSKSVSYPPELKKKESIAIGFIENIICDALTREEMNTVDLQKIIAGAYYFVLKDLKRTSDTLSNQSSLLSLIEGKFDFEDSQFDIAIMLDCISSLSFYIDISQKDLIGKKTISDIATFREEIRVVEKDLHEGYEDWVVLDDNDSLVFNNTFRL